MTIRTDKRQIETSPRPEVHRRLLAGQVAWLDQEIRLAKDLAVIDESKHFAEVGGATLREYATRIGYRGTLAPGQARMGRAFVRRPELERLVRAGRIRIENAEAISAVLLDSALEGTDDWLAMAQAYTLPTLRQKAARRIEEVLQQERELLTIRLFVTEQTRSDFRRACAVARTRSGTSLSEGQAFGVVVDDYLDRNDPLRKATKPPRGKPPPTGATPEPSAPVAEANPDPDATAGADGKAGAEGRAATSPNAARGPASAPSQKDGADRPRKRSRTVPAAVERRIWARARGECEIPGCHGVEHLEICHVHGHAQGGGQDEKNLLLLCPRHHRLLDAHRLDLLGWTEDDLPVVRCGARILWPEPRAGPSAAGPPA